MNAIRFFFQLNIVVSTQASIFYLFFFSMLKVEDRVRRGFGFLTS